MGFQMDRRLEGEGAGEGVPAIVAPPPPVQPGYNVQTLGTYTCFLDGTQAATYLADFGIFIAGAMKACSDRTDFPKNQIFNREAHRVYGAMTGMSKSILNVYGACEKKHFSQRYDAAEKVT